MKKLLVTGGAGFIGSEFVRVAVKKGYRAAVVDKLTYAGDLERIKEVEKDIIFYKADITDKGSVEDIFKKEKPEAIIHFAAESHVDRSIMDAAPFLENNVNGTLVLLEASKRFGVERFINISTDEVYGELGNDGQFFETTPLNPNSPYSVSKASADMLGRAYYRTYGLPVITVRPSNNYGPWQYPEKVIPFFITRMLEDKKLPVYGDGKNVRDWIYVLDHCRALELCLLKGRPGEVYNIGADNELNNLEMVRHILKYFKKDNSYDQYCSSRCCNWQRWW